MGKEKALYPSYQTDLKNNKSGGSRRHASVPKA
jgi:hypothetical protein